MDNDLTTQNPVTIAPIDVSDDFKRRAQENITIALETLSYKNEREYKATYTMWQEYNLFNGNSSLNFDLVLVKNFLTDNNWSFNTRKTRLAHLRKYSELLALSDKNNEYNFAYNFSRFKLLKPKTLGGSKNVATKHILSPREVFAIFDSVVGDSNKNTRNRALLGLLVIAGLRASEVVNLKWKHIDYKPKTLFVFEGKGEKSANVPMLGSLPYFLKQWQIQQAKHGQYEYVCSEVFRSDKIATDKLCTTRIINSLCKKVTKETGITIKPHDLRRTAITSLLDGGASVPQTRDFARHESGETTLIYAAKNDAVALRHTLHNKMEYADVYGDVQPSDNTRSFECDCGHIFVSIDGELCPKCLSENISHQTNMFD